jgi:hypothetical protein
MNIKFTAERLTASFRAIIAITGVAALLIAAGLGGCGRFGRHKDPPGQWILESYSVERGYVLRKDGFRYRAHCRGMFGPLMVDGVDIRAGLVPIPSGPTRPESECTNILPYMNKPVPLTQFAGADAVLQYHQTEDGTYKGWITEFVITEAKQE